MPAFIARVSLHALVAGNRPMGELNTTPLIDVMLVLLVMFIITIPMQTHSVKIDLSTAGKPTGVNPVRNKVSIDSDNVVAWNGRAIDQRELAVLLAETRRFPVAPELQFQPDERALWCRRPDAGDDQAIRRGQYGFRRQRTLCPRLLIDKRRWLIPFCTRRGSAIGRVGKRPSCRSPCGRTPLQGCE